MASSTKIKLRKRSLEPVSEPNTDLKMEWLSLQLQRAFTPDQGPHMQLRLNEYLFSFFFVEEGA